MFKFHQQLIRTGTWWTTRIHAVPRSQSETIGSQTPTSTTQTTRNSQTTLERQP